MCLCPLQGGCGFRHVFVQMCVSGLVGVFVHLCACENVCVCAVENTFQDTNQSRLSGEAGKCLFQSLRSQETIELSGVESRRDGTSLPWAGSADQKEKGREAVSVWLRCFFPWLW